MGGGTCEKMDLNDGMDGFPKLRSLPKFFLAWKYSRILSEYFPNTRKTKLRIWNVVLRSMVLYGCKSWSLTARDRSRLFVFENRIHRHIQHLPSLKPWPLLRIRPWRHQKLNDVKKRTLQRSQISKQRAFHHFRSR